MKREAILNSMLELVSQYGIHNTPMSKIARHANVAAGTIYHHFNSKEEILNELYLKIKSDLGESIEEVLKKKLSVQEQFGTVWMSIYDYYTAHPLRFIFIEQTNYTPIITAETHQKSLIHYQAVMTFFKDNIENGNFREMEPTLMGQLIYGNIRTLVQMKLNDENSVNEEILNEGLNTSWLSIINRNV